jgi:hypothetical protein
MDARSSVAQSAERPAVHFKCRWHLCDKPLTGRQEKFCSPQCKNKYYVARRRRELKQRAVAHKGGKCLLCGYDQCLDALSFHHLSGKDFGLAYRGYTRAWEKVREELDKCILVCLNCHAEIHAGLHDTVQPYSAMDSGKTG